MESLLPYIAMPVSALAALCLFVKIIGAIKNRKYGVDVLALLAVVSTIVAAEYLASLIIVIMLMTGELLERYANRRAKKELTTLIDHRPQRLHQLNGPDLPAKSIKPDTRLLIKTGEMIIIDGTLLSPTATLDTGNITGEALPITVNRNAKITSGSLNIGPPIEMKTTKRLADSEFSQLAKAVSDIEKQPAPFVRLADRYAVPFTIVSLVIAAIAWVISGDFTRFAEVLVLASPCPLILAAPIAYISGMSKAMGQGILIKNGTYLEKLSSVKSIAFDKTGTLSSGKITVSNIESFSKKYTPHEILKIVASCEKGSVHILAQSIVDHANSLHIHFAHISDLRDHVGYGIDATFGGKNIVIGSLSHLKTHHIPLRRQTSSSSIYLAINQKLVGRIDFHDSLRVGALTTVHALKTLGIEKVAMVTGDNLAQATRVATLLGITDIYANQLPTDKIKTIRSLRPKPTLFVGDGLNDAPTLAAADVSIAMGAFGSPLAIESADIVIMTSNIGKIPVAIEIARATKTTATRSVFIGMGACLLLMVVATTGFIPATIGAILQEVIDTLSIASALSGKKIK
jgi:heavy metal translocating P-type ATPase